MRDGLGQSFAEALGRKDAAALRELLHPRVDFRAMTPQKFWESDDVDHIIDDIFFSKWFGPEDDITDIISIESATVEHRERVGYRFRVVNPDGAHVVDQQVYLERDGNRIGWLRLMCAGYLRVGDDET